MRLHHVSQVVKAFPYSLVSTNVLLHAPRDFLPSDGGCCEYHAFIH